MVAVAARDAESFVRSRFAQFPVILIYGPDEGLVSERAATIAVATVGGDKGNILRLDGDEVSADPLRLADEANAISMFGGARAIRIKAGARSFVAALTPLIASPPYDARIIIEAGDLKGGHALRALIEKTESAAALPCYAEDARGLARLLDEMLDESGLTIQSDARQALLGQLGADRRRSRMEIEKLLLYCARGGTIAVADVEAVVTDAAALSQDAVVDAAFLGRLDGIENEARRLFADGQDAAMLLGVALRQAFLLQSISRDLGANRNAAESIKSHKVSWKREKAVMAQAERWTEIRIARAVQILADAMLHVRRQPVIGQAIAIRALWSIALAVARR